MNIALAPAQRRFIEEQVKSGRYVDAGEVVRAALRLFEARAAANSATYTVLGAMPEGDIEALAFIVLMEAAKSAQEDLKAIMAQVKAINAAKQAHRDLLDQMQRDQAANFGREKDEPLDFSTGLGSERAYHRVPMPHADPTSEGGVRYVVTDLHPGKITKAALCAIAESMKNKLDSLSEMGEMESLRLQMAMDRRSKMMDALSNMLKTLGDTAQAITQNLK
jgi:putative addiction module CopG family antidote